MLIDCINISPLSILYFIRFVLFTAIIDSIFVQQQQQQQQKELWKWIAIEQMKHFKNN